MKYLQAEYLTCDCSSDEHTMRFTFAAGETSQDSSEVYTSVFLNQYRSVWRRIWVAVRYVMGYKSKYGHWDCFSFNVEEAIRLRKLLQEFENDVEAASKKTERSDNEK